jgi:hypothetical protein
VIGPSVVGEPTVVIGPSVVGVIVVEVVRFVVVVGLTVVLGCLAVVLVVFTVVVVVLTVVVVSVVVVVDTEVLAVAASVEDEALSSSVGKVVPPCAVVEVATTAGLDVGSSAARELSLLRNADTMTAAQTSTTNTVTRSTGSSRRQSRGGAWYCDSGTGWVGGASVDSGSGSHLSRFGSMYVRSVAG